MKDTLTIEDIQKVQQELLSQTHVKPSINPFQFGNSFMGMKVVEVPVKTYPKLKIRDDFKWCSEEARAKMNTWLLAEFGTREECPLKASHAYMVGSHILMVRPETMSLIKGSVI